MMEQKGCFHKAEGEQMCSEDNNILDMEENVFKDLLVKHALEWPSLTAQIANVQIPNENPQRNALDYDYESVNWKVEINHEGEVNKACFMSQNPYIIATQTSYGDVLVFDCTKQPSEPDPSGKCSPELTLKGHGQEGYGLSWNPILNGYLVSASYDHAISFWDVNSMTANRGVIGAIATFKEHASVVNDNMFGSVGNDETLMIWDTRLYNTTRIIRAHTAAVNCLAFNPYQEFILATGSADETIALWDLRNLKSTPYSIELHKDATIQLQWGLRAVHLFRH